MLEELVDTGLGRGEGGECWWSATRFELRTSSSNCSPCFGLLDDGIDFVIRCLSNVVMWDYGDTSRYWCGSMVVCRLCHQQRHWGKDLKTARSGTFPI